MNIEKEIIEQVSKSIEIQRSLENASKTIDMIVALIVESFRKGNKVLIFGNGGSSADAEHIAGELAGRFTRDREPLPAISLSSNTASLTAIANDYGYEAVFARQVRAIVKAGDIVIGNSTSGNSLNVLYGIEEAKLHDAVIIAFVGGGGKLKNIADYVLSIPSVDTPRVQEVHMLAGNFICYLVEKIISEAEE